MKTEDELDAEIVKLFDKDTTTKVEMVNGKPRISDQAIRVTSLTGRRRIFTNSVQIFEPCETKSRYPSRSFCLAWSARDRVSVRSGTTC
jgi:hypothetical protein